MQTLITCDCGYQNRIKDGDKCKGCDKPLPSPSGSQAGDGSLDPLDGRISCDCGGAPHGRGCSLVLNGLIEYSAPELMETPRTIGELRARFDSPIEKITRGDDTAQTQTLKGNEI